MDLDVLSFAHPDADRADKEAMLRDLPQQDFIRLYQTTRQAARLARQNGDMERLYGLTRGLKTLQRISGERGFRLGA
ncbi:hypothetical protein LF95_03195 [Thalassospira sp. TSL5-1]|nr:hypothetical protein LF95_03195 [Thalassospira sp. TSL5-1]